MGTDIHAIIEYRRHGSDFLAFTEGGILIPRDRKLFSILAFGDGGVTDNLMYPPRGLPDNLSFEARNLFFLEESEIKEMLLEAGEEFQPQEIAASWGEWAQKEYQSSGRLPSLDLHTPSWLNYSELNEILANDKLEASNVSAEFRAVIAAMQVLAETYGTEKVRLVFWFDS